VRLGLVCPYEWGIPGGVQTQVAGLAAALGRMGHSVIVIAPHSSSRRLVRAGGGGGDSISPGVSGADSPPGAPATNERYRVVAAGRSIPIPVNGSMAPVAPTPAAMARTVRALRRFRPDVVHVHEPLTPGPSLAAMFGGPRPIVATFHRSGTDPLYMAEGRLLGAVTARAGRCVAVSEAAAATARAALGRHLAGSDLVIVPNGVDLGIYARARQEAAGTPATLAPDGRTIVFVGRHEDRKGLRVLLEALSGLPPEVRLDVLGAGPLTAELRRGFPDQRIHWLGAVSDEAKARSLASADLFVAPSIEGESFGVVLLEAMAAGTAVVASDLPGYRMAGGEAARFVPPGDPRLLACALTALLTHPGQRQRLVEAGEKVALAHSMESIARRYEDLYRSVRRLEHPTGTPAPPS
jgi:phosphatidylinositol alpha-mannosyltransferase